MERGRWRSLWGTTELSVRRTNKCSCIYIYIYRKISCGNVKSAVTSMRGERWFLYYRKNLLCVLLNQTRRERKTFEFWNTSSLHQQVNKNSYVLPTSIHIQICRPQYCELLWRIDKIQSSEQMLRKSIAVCLKLINAVTFFVIIFTQIFVLFR